MADSTPLLPQMAAASDDREIVFNGVVDALSPASLYGRDYENCTGLVFAGFGGFFNNVDVANWTVTATGSNTNYVVAHRTTGAVTVSTATTNRDNVATYLYLYELTAGPSTITSYLDKRQVLTTGNAPSATTFLGLTDTPSSYASQTLKIVRVNAGETALEFATVGGGDASTNTATSVDSEITLFSSTTGKLLKRATGTGYAKVTSGVLGADSTATVRTDLQGSGLTAGEVGFREVPQNSQSTAYTLVAADAGKHILHPSADTTARTWTIPANSGGGSVAFPVGAAITFVNQNAGGVITIDITTDTMRLAGPGTTGSRALAANGIATALKITTTEWIISGTGLT